MSLIGNPQVFRYDVALPGRVLDGQRNVAYFKIVEARHRLPAVKATVQNQGNESSTVTLAISSTQLQTMADPWISEPAEESTNGAAFLATFSDNANTGAVVRGGVGTVALTNPPAATTLLRYTAVGSNVKITIESNVELAQLI
jgi:hypothetical protein